MEFYGHQLDPNDPNSPWIGVKYAYLKKRKNDGWSARRRRFLPTRAELLVNAKVDGPRMPVGILVELSFDSGFTWRGYKLEVTVERDRCAITIGDDNLHAIIDDRPGGSGLSFAEAYIEGKLRVRVHANVEGDDAAIAIATPSGESYLLRNWWDAVSRSNLRRKLRYTTELYQPIANSELPQLPPKGYHVWYALNDDSWLELKKLALLLRDEFELRRTTGQFTIPWLWRPYHGPRWGYEIGDEVLAIETGLSTTRLSLLGSRAQNEPAPRIIGIDYTYADEPEEQSTTIRLESRVYKPEDVIGDPRLPMGA